MKDCKICTDDGEPINLKFVRDYEEEEWPYKKY